MIAENDAILAKFSKCLKFVNTPRNLEASISVDLSQRDLSNYTSKYAF